MENFGSPFFLFLLFGGSWIKNHGKLYKLRILNIFMETITIPKEKFEQMIIEISFLRNSAVYNRLLNFEYNILKGKKYSRKDLGF